MKKIVSFFAVTLLFGLTAFQCGNEVDCCAMPPCSEEMSLTGSWQLEYYQNISTGAKDPDPGIEEKSVIYQFSDDRKKGKIEGHTFANEVFGAYELGTECTLRVLSFGGTKVGEPGWSGKAWFPSDSTGKAHYQVSNDRLIINFAARPEMLVFKKQK